MEKQHDGHRKKIFHSLSAILIAIAPFNSYQTAQAITPYVYLPAKEQLVDNAIEIGKEALKYLELGHPNKAALLAALAVRLHPNDELLWTILAESQLRSNQLDNAAKSLAQAKKLNPTKAGLWFAQASMALSEEKPEIAIPLINRGLELDPKNASAYFNLGNARIMQNKLKKALKSFEKATSLKPNFWEALNNQALVLYELGKEKEAIKRWRKVIKIQSNSEPMLALASALYLQDSKNNESIELAKLALAKNPNYVLPDHQREQLWGNRIRKAAAKLLEIPLLSSSVERAQANATWKQGN